MAETPTAEDKDRRNAAGEDATREAPRQKSAEEVRREAAQHDKRVRRFLLRLSLANWGVAVIAWMISAYLGITSPASIFVYSVLFVIGLVAAIIAIVTYLLEKFGHEPSPQVHDEEAADADAAEEGRGGDTALPPAETAATFERPAKTAGREDAAAAPAAGRDDAAAAPAAGREDATAPAAGHEDATAPAAGRPVAPGATKEGVAGGEPASAPSKAASAPPPSDGAPAPPSKDVAAGDAPATDGNAPPPARR